MRAVVIQRMPFNSSGVIMRLVATGFALICCCALSQAYAQTAPQQQQAQKPSPEEMQRIMESTFGLMVPMMGKMTEAMIQAQLKLAVLPQTAEDISTFKRN